MSFRVKRARLIEVERSIKLGKGEFRGWAHSWHRNMREERKYVIVKCAAALDRLMPRHCNLMIKQMVKRACSGTHGRGRTGPRELITGWRPSAGRPDQRLALAEWRMIVRTFYSIRGSSGAQM